MPYIFFPFAAVVYTCTICSTFSYILFLSMQYAHVTSYCPLHQIYVKLTTLQQKKERMQFFSFFFFIRILAQTPPWRVWGAGSTLGGIGTLACPYRALALSWKIVSTFTTYTTFWLEPRSPKFTWSFGAVKQRRGTAPPGPGSHRHSGGFPCRNTWKEETQGQFWNWHKNSMVCNIPVQQKH